MTAAKIIEANHKEFIGIKGFTRANQVIPPTRIFVICVMLARHMMMPRKRMANEHRIGFVGIEFAVSLIHEVELRQHLTAF